MLVLTISPDGSLTIPAAALALVQLSPGDTVRLSEDSGRLFITSERQTPPVAGFSAYLERMERSPATIAQYCRVVERFYAFLGSERRLNREATLDYKRYLTATLKPSGANAAIAALNSYFSFLGREDLRLRPLRVQRQAYCPQELTYEEYCRLIATARERGNERMALLAQTLAATGMRISELPFVTVEALAVQRAEVNCKGKNRTVFLPESLCQALGNFAKEQEITSGPVFVTRNGLPMDRSNIWGSLKDLANYAGIPPEKVYPHSFRHLFARQYYSLHGDLAKLADLLGHNSIDTTRIYIVTTGDEHAKQVESLGFVL